MTETQELVQLILKDFLTFLEAEENKIYQQNLLDNLKNPSMYNDCHNNQDRS